jgi:hypothetical protein
MRQLALAIFGFGISVMLLTGCDHTLAGKWEYKEVNRLKSPDGLVEAVTIEGDAGATTSTVTSLYLVPSGQRIKDEDRERSVFDADHHKKLNFIWREPRLLEIQFEEARIFNFRNFWNGLPGYQRVVEVRLSPATTNYSLPERDSGRSPR